VRPIVLPEIEESRKRMPGRDSERVLKECYCRGSQTPTIGHDIYAFRQLPCILRGCCNLLGVYVDVDVIYVTRPDEVSPNGYIGCSFCRLIRRPEHIIGRNSYLPAN
jgi:hypothetical protein